ncbi:MAG: nickel-responsive transcriptional regulator NikR [Synergistetes bacterium]|nr:nickel-responsive transcriptional regulator NikR [Synergistota bacterium]MCX8127657.1 nickel-responsive transcriptional regulator NikR [Synergistota bacterium]MDW8191427.1 nickel-responsive transcriptional regulator NikR [Synergistota bacterium]
MSKLVRFGVSMEEDLLERFDKIIALKGYENRSEAIRDLMRNFILEEEWEKTTGKAMAVLVIVYDHHKKDVTEMQHGYLKEIVSTLHLHVDEDNCLEVILLKGDVQDLKDIASKIGSQKGVKYAKLIPAVVGEVPL